MAAQRIGFVRAMKYHLMREFMGDIAYMSQARLARNVIKKRGTLWEKGGIRDIKKGNYFAFCNFIPAQMKDPELFDKAKLFRNSQDGFGWTKGLANNVYLRIGKKHVLVMDNHNFAAAFIIEMFKRGVVGKKSAMVHMDDHPDYFGVWGRFRFQNYSALKTDSERMRYLMQNTTIEEWMHLPLFKPLIVDQKKLAWLRLHEKSFVWCDTDPIVTAMQKRLASIRQLSQGNRWDIADIDIDVLSPLDRTLSKEEKAGILKGKISQRIMDKLVDMAWMAKRANVITIATSPCFIAQDRALVYVKALLSLLRKSYT